MAATVLVVMAATVLDLISVFPHRTVMKISATVAGWVADMIVSVQTMEVATVVTAAVESHVQLA